MLGNYCKVSLVAKKISLFAKHVAFLWDCFKNIKAWKTIDLWFVKHEHDILELVGCFKRKEENILHYMHDKEVLLIKHISKADLFSKSNSNL